MLAAGAGAGAETVQRRHPSVQPSQGSVGGYGPVMGKTGKDEEPPTDDVEGKTDAAKGFRGIRLGPDTIHSGEGWTLNDNERRRVESWLAGLLQTEHLSLLVGNGLSTAVGSVIGTAPPTMTDRLDAGGDTKRIRAHAERSAEAMGRQANFEDDVRSALALMEGYVVLGEGGRAEALSSAVEDRLKDFIAEVLKFEHAIGLGHATRTTEARKVATLLQRFLLPFSARGSGRDRLSLFTTNYDRVLEFAGDLLGLRLIDRFAGTVEPTFSASRLDLDMHYSPPGIRGEPRLLEGVVRYAKLHGSVDWRATRQRIVKVPLAFGADRSHPSFPTRSEDMAVIYPNPAKDVETLNYPYAELFRDLAAAVCRPNATLVTYGYGFGDSHINRVIADMLTIPSTHLVVVSYGELKGLENFKDGLFPRDQTTELIGPSVGSLESVVDFLPSLTSIGVLEAQMVYAERASRAAAANAGDSAAAGATDG